MTKKILTVVLICLLCVTVLVACNPKANEEEILPEQTISIATVEDLVNINNYTGIKYSKYIFKLENDLDLSQINIWQPIGTDRTSAFMGKFDGNNKTLSNLTIKGWEDNGNPIFVGKDSYVDNEKVSSSVGLFGYTKNAEISNLTLNNVNIYYYTDSQSAYTAALVGYDIGTSKFANITTSGKISLSNTFSQRKTFDNKGEEQGIVEECDAMQYLAGVVAYSNGNGTFSNLKSTITLQNAVYKAIYRQADAENYIEEGYSLSYGDYKNIMVDQVFAGGIFGLIKNGNLDQLESSSNIKVKAKSSFVGGIGGALYGSDAKNLDAKNQEIESKIHTKNTMGGAIGLLDNSTFADSVISDIVLKEECLANNVQSTIGGGAVGYAIDGASISDIVIKNVTVSSMYDNSIMGGVCGVVYNSTLKNCQAENGIFASNSLNANRHEEAAYNEFFKYCASIVGKIYGNSNISSSQSNVNNLVKTNLVPNTKTYAAKEVITYVNDDGFPAVRFFKNGSYSEYIVAYATYNSGNLQVIFYSEESKILVEHTYSGVEQVAGTDSDSEKYKNVFFVANKGIVASDGSVIAFENRNTAKYVYLSGKPVIDEATLILN